MTYPRLGLWKGRYQGQNPELYFQIVKRQEQAARKTYNARGISIDICEGLRSGDRPNSCSVPSESLGEEEEYFTSSSIDPELFLIDRMSSTSFLNDGRTAGSLFQHAWSRFCSEGVLNRESGMAGRVLSSKVCGVK